MSAVVLALAALCLPPAQAAPWIAPGDSWLRADIQLLADAGVIQRPVNTWPISLPDIAQDIAGVDMPATLDAAEQAALVRLRRLLRAEMRVGERRYSARLGLAASPDRVRGFADTPRGELEAEVASEYTGERVAVRAQAQVVQRDRADDRRMRPDGTVAGVVAGNWMATAGWQARHWGPGWSGSLVLGNATRPIPGVAVQRLHAEPFEWPVLEWLGPWTLTAFAGRVEGFSLEDIAPEEPAAGTVQTRTNSTLVAARAAARPLQSLEVGVSAARLTDDSGNRLSAIDVRWQPRLPGFNFAAYGQVAREHGSGEIPAGNTALVGVEHWGRSDRLGGNWRAVVEHTDTACNGLVGGSTTFGCSYAHDRYAPGYRHRGRPIAHGADADARLTTVAVQLRRDVGDDFQVRARFGRLDRGDLGATGDGLNTVTDGRARFTDIEASFRRDAQVGTLELGAGYQRLAMDDGRSRNDLRGFVGFTVQF
ncbi:MAG: hypothetical protein JJT93_13240 [Gammaproteobacteria bacterium]|nr:hypothetical protein [Gammaproteobacteria bacterium]